MNVTSFARGVVALALALPVVACGCGGGSRGGHSEDPQQLVLQLRDLPRGYQYGDDSTCGPVYGAEGEWPKLNPLFAKERPDVCIIELAWVWEGEPKYANGLTSAAYVFDDSSGAHRAFAARDELATFTATLTPKTEEPLDLGDEAELIRGRGLNNPASGVVWRDRNVVELVVAEPANDDGARELAARQQKHIARPSRPVTSENDPELQLDDPSLKLPVHWLGRRFDPPGDLPPLELDLATVGGNGPGQSVQLWYGVEGFSDTVTFDTWQPATWKRFLRTRLGRLIWDSPCARKTVVQVDGGRAEIFEGYGAPNPVKRPCPAGPPNRVVGHVYYDDEVVAVNLPYCYGCARPEPQRSPYQTVQATKTLVDSLRLRTPRR